MAGPSPGVVATVVLASVTLSLPCFLYGAWYILEVEAVTWGALIYHLKFVTTGLVLTTVPVVVWMAPRLPDQFGGLSALHAFFGVQAYALLAFGFTGIVRIFRAKYEHDLYHDYDEDVLLDEIGSEQMDHWRFRLRVGVFGYTICWLLAYVIGVVRFVIRYLL
mgnify:CR=1 FL=1